MKPLASALALLVVGTTAFIPSVSDAGRGFSGRGGGGFHGSSGHASAFHGGGGHAGVIRRGVPFAGAHIRPFRAAPPIRVFHGSRHFPVFVGGVVAAAPLYAYAPYYAYSTPYYSAAPDYIAPEAASAYWYYCAAYRAYYPYVQDCPGGWQAVTPQPY